MKPLLVLLLGGVMSTSAGAAFLADAVVDRPRVVPVILSNQFLLAGEVIARTEHQLTVLSVGSQLTTVHVTSDTEILKGAETLALSDIAIGDKVSVTVMKLGDGDLHAVKVEVRTGYD